MKNYVSLWYQRSCYITVNNYITGGFGHNWIKLTSEEEKETTYGTFDIKGHQKFRENVELTGIPY